MPIRRSTGMATIMLSSTTFHGFLLTLSLLLICSARISLTVAVGGTVTSPPPFPAKEGLRSNSLVDPSMGKGGEQSERKSPSASVKGSVQCPSECSCARDSEGRLEVLCLRGNSNKSRSISWTRGLNLSVASVVDCLVGCLVVNWR